MFYYAEIKINSIIFIGADDPRCPLAGLQTPFQKTKDAYKKFSLPENFEVLHTH